MHFLLPQPIHKNIHLFNHSFSAKTSKEPCLLLFPSVFSNISRFFIGMFVDVIEYSANIDDSEFWCIITPTFSLNCGMLYMLTVPAMLLTINKPPTLAISHKSYLLWEASC